MAIEHASLIETPPIVRPDSARPDQEMGLGEFTGVAFSTALDTINPLQNIPGVSSAYRAVTGDEANPVARAAGGFIFGGPIGAGIGLATGLLEMMTGKDPLDHAMALLQGDNAKVVAGHIEGGATTTGDALMPDIAAMAEDDAKTLTAAEYERRPGFGASRKTVEMTANVYTSQALSQVSGLYEQAQALQGETSRGRHSRSA